MSNATTYPLSWPDGWPRTPASQVSDGRYSFRRNGHHSGNPFWTFVNARDALYDELRKLGADNAIISSNFRTSRDGIPVEGGRRPTDQAIAVYFQLDGQPIVMARDSYVRIEENMRSLTLAIEAMRQLERHGGSLMMRKAFAGFMALPPPAKDETRPWWEVLDVPPGATRNEIERAFKEQGEGRPSRHRRLDRGHGGTLFER